MVHKLDAERIAHKYSAHTHSQSPHRDIGEALRFLADYAVDRREQDDMRTLARYVLEDRTADASLRMLAQEVI
tara:strand:+ start:416 stop:634 length:219 start_codon:yes stop_codon:yes gene_type:complete